MLRSSADIGMGPERATNAAAMMLGQMLLL
jgi:hypothetical protein